MQVYLLTQRLAHYSLISLRSRGAVLESLPWFAYHIAKLPVLSEKFRKIREQANQRARERIQRGTSSKDLFHYLVSSVPVMAAQTDTRYPEQRGRLGSSYSSYRCCRR